MTASAPVVASTACARAREVTSPEATTGTSTSETSSAVSAWSAVPVYICWAERGCSVMRRRARLDEPWAELERGARAVLHAAAQLDGHRDLDRARDRLDDAAGAIRILEEVGAGARSW